MKGLKWLITVVILLISGQISVGASRKGKVLEQDSKTPVELAGIAFLSQDSTYVESIMADSIGEFKIPDNQRIRLVKITAPGFIPLLTSIPDSTEPLFLMQPNETSLNEVTVSAKKQAFVVKQDKIVFNPMFVPSAINAYDILRFAPGIIDTGNSLVMAAKDGMKVLIDGKEQKGTMAEIILLLKSFQASDVDSVEILTAPSARHARGANVGVVNIVLKKRTTDYLGGSAYYSLGVNSDVTNSLSAGIHYTSSKLFTSLNAYGSIFPYSFRESNTTLTDDDLYQDYLRCHRNQKYLSLKWALDYYFSKKWTLSLAAMYSGSNLKHNADAFSTVIEKSLPLTAPVENKAYRHEKSNTAFGSVEVNGHLSSKALLSASVDYYGRYMPSSRSQTDRDGAEEFGQDYKTSSSNVTAKTNLDLNLSEKLALDFGVDYMYTRTHNKADYTSFEITNLYNDYLYHENELDIFGQIRYTLNSKINFDATLRYQNLLMKGKNRMDESDNFRRHADVFAPSFSIGYRINDINSFRLYGYYNMAQPSLQSLTPTMLYVSPNSYRVGNPNLREARHFMGALTYTYRNLMIEPYFELLNHGIAETGYVDGNGNRIYTWDNLMRTRTYALYMYWGWSSLDWLNLSLSQFVLYSTHRTTDNLRKANGWKYTIRPYINFYLTNNRKLILTLDGNFSSGYRNVDADMKATWSGNMSLMWRFHSNWSLSLAGQDLLVSHTRGTLHLNNAEMEFDNKYSYPKCELTISYTWGRSTRYRRDRDAKYKMDSRTDIKN
jgi:hypothetical protein